MGRTRKVPYTKGMSPPMAARWAFVCVLVTIGVSPAFAERRPVAVVNLDVSDDSKATQLAGQLGEQLDSHPDLRPVQSTDAAALKDRIDDPDRAGLEAAQNLKERAEAHLVEFNYALATTRAQDGQRELLGVTPMVARKLYADLALIEGQALLANGRVDEARDSFALCARLDPQRSLDTARYLPEVVTAFAKAKAMPAPPGSISVLGPGRVWVDSIELGQAPGGFSVAAGRHVVWLTGPDRTAAGAGAIVVAGKPTEVTIRANPEDRRLNVQRARITLARAADATAKAGAMNALAKLVGVEDAVLLHVVGDKVIVQTWRAGNVERSPGFSALRERTEKEKAIDLLTPLAPPKQRVDPEDGGPFVKPKPIVVKKWYQRRPVQVGIVVGVLGAIVGGYLIATGGIDSLFFNPDTQIDRPMTGRK